MATIKTAIMSAKQFSEITKEVERSAAISRERTADLLEEVKKLSPLVGLLSNEALKEAVKSTKSIDERIAFTSQTRQAIVASNKKMKERIDDLSRNTAWLDEATQRYWTLQASLPVTIDSRIESIGLTVAEISSEIITHPSSMVNSTGSRVIETVDQQQPEMIRIVDQALHSGKLDRKDLMLLLLKKEKPGPKEADIQIKIKLVEKFEQVKNKSGSSFTQQMFVDFYAEGIYPCSLATFKRYYKEIKTLRELELI